MAITSSGQGGTTSSKTTGTTLAINFGTGGVVGDLWVVVFASLDTAGTYSIDDTQHMAWQQDEQRTNATNIRVYIWSGIQLSNVNTTITVTHPSMTPRAMWMQSFRPSSGSSFDTTRKVNSTGTTGNSTTFSSGSLTVTSTSDIYIGGAAENGDGADSYTQDANFLNAFTFPQGTTGGGASSNVTVLAGYDLTAATEAYAPTRSATNRQWASAVVEYQEVVNAAQRPARPIQVIPQAVNRAATY